MKVSRNIATIGLMIASSVVSVSAYATVNAAKHPQMAQAQNLISQAYAQVTAAQNAHNYNLGGHGDNAKNLLMQASAEIDAAAAAADSQ